MSDVCFECGNEAKHKHHVIPKVLGGTKTIPLCEECHSKVHGADLTLENLRRIGTRKAIERFKQEGKKWGGGGWNKLDCSNYGEIKNLRTEGLSLRAIANKFKVTPQTIHNVLKRIATNESEV
jgi:hypothetical protein